jgi:hypothetical protein
MGPLQGPIALEVIPETDDSFIQPFGVDEDFESTHQHLKMTLLNGRARSVGRHRQLFDFHGYEAHVAITTRISLDSELAGQRVYRNR